ncbi:hypothetical protein [Streptomyces viridochromogenes]|uniref:hypothetical protein n=1 Tax=Streptomyces viridochromogenes TaxID=1938 RepID=UPI00099B9606|nr:hypothetical protein [Streptomyces viridochromogenes]
MTTLRRQAARRCRRPGRQRRSRGGAFATRPPPVAKEALANGRGVAGPALTGVPLVLLRQFPGARKYRKYFAYLPEGPVADWTNPDFGTVCRRS